MIPFVSISTLLLTFHIFDKKRYRVTTQGGRLFRNEFRRQTEPIYSLRLSSSITDSAAVLTSPHTKYSTRYLAAKALIPWKNHTAYAVDRLESSLSYSQLSERDRAFSRLIVTTTERRLGQIDAVLNACFAQQSKQRSQKLRAVDYFVESVLRIGAAQSLFLDIPPHAVVKETVDVLRIDPKLHVTDSRIKFVNAVLRRISREGKELLETTTSILDNVAPWLVDEWQRDWGFEVTSCIVEAAMQETPRCLTVRQNPTTSPDYTQKQLEEISNMFEDSEILTQGSIRVVKTPPGPISTWPLYHEGLWWLQDVSASLPAIVLYNALSDGGKADISKMHVVDLCAAPGGKTAQLASFGFEAVTALDVSAKRCERLTENMNRLDMNWNTVVADGRQWVPDTKVHGVLLDAPCTATGTASRRPDVLRRKAEIGDLLETQYQLLSHVADSVLDVGGTVVYATCSLLKSESEDQISKLLSRSQGSVMVTKPILKGEIPGFDEAIDKNGWIRILPGTLPGSMKQVDGFFIARLVRVS